MNKDARLAGALCAVAAALSLLAAGCAGRGDPPAEKPAAEQNPYETTAKFGQGVKPSTKIPSARERCMAKQRARLEGCGEKTGQDRAICEAVAKELMTVCEQMNPDAPAHLANALFCSGICAIKTYPPEGGPKPDGTGLCFGNICANENSLCDPGVLFDCF